jgi:hypothetical protein
LKESRKIALVVKLVKMGLEDKILKYLFKPISVGFFGGILDHYNMSFLRRKALEVGYKGQIQQRELKDFESTIYNLRNWDETRSCVIELVYEAEGERF